MFRNFKITAAFAVVFLVTFSHCITDFQEFKLITKKTVATSYLTFERNSDIRCVERCYAEGKQERCTIAAFNTATMSCRLSMDSQQDVVDISDDSSGVYIFQPHPAVVTQGILDDRMTLFL